jgi:glycosyltransferase involved in cell wall biosynthesis
VNSNVIDIGIIIPTFNRASIVSESIDSVLAQSHAAREIIVVDDGSTDDTQAVLARYGNQIRVIRQAHAGPSEARNNGIRAASSNWIAFLDDDDTFTPDRLEHAAEAIQRHPDVNVHMSNLAIITDGGKEEDLFKTRHLHATEIMRVPRPIAWCLRGCCFVQTLVIERKALLGTGLFREMFYEDLDFVLRLCSNVPWTVDRHPSVRLSRRTGQTLSVSEYWQSKPIENFETLVSIFRSFRDTAQLNPTEKKLVDNSMAAKLYELGRVYFLDGQVERALACFKECADTAPRFKTRLKSWCPRMIGKAGLRLVDRSASIERYFRIAFGVNEYYRP